MIAREQVERSLAEAAAIYCPRCKGDKTGWERNAPWRRHCYDCGRDYTADQLRKPPAPTPERK